MKKLHTLAIEQKEDTKHGEAIFPVQKYNTILSSVDNVVTTHWHEETEFTLITQGQADYQIDLTTYPVKEGDLLFIPPLVLHAISPRNNSVLPTKAAAGSASEPASESAAGPASEPASESTAKLSDKRRNKSGNAPTNELPYGQTTIPCSNTPAPILSPPLFTSESYVFHMNFLGGNSTDICSARYLTPLANQKFTMPYLISKSHPAYADLRKLFHQIHTLCDEAAFGYELSLKAHFLQAIFLMLQYSEQTREPDNSALSDKLKLVLDYIELHYAENLSVSKLAGLVYFSEYHFMRFFKKHMNMTCVEYINAFRLEKAVKLFEQGNTSILDVSLSVGFHNLSYFYKLFKRKYQMTPKAFLKELK